jgi:hypothetical protein
MGRLDVVTKILLALITLGVWGLLLDRAAGPPPALAQAKPAPQTFEEISVQRVNIVDPNGKPRLVLSNAEKFPNPVVNGKELTRDVKPAGLVFYNTAGNECGGVAVVGSDKGEQSMIILNYANSEAIGFGKFEGKKGSYAAGLSVTDRIALDTDVKKVGATGVERITISNNSGDAALVLSDPQGKPRIRLSVDARGTANIRILDRNGKDVFRALR